jgi:hypothetical protein
MMFPKSGLRLGLVMLVSVSAIESFAKKDAEYGNFSLHYGSLQYATNFMGISQAQLESARDLNVGPSSYRLQGSETPWAGNFFPMQDGGLANRWQTSATYKYTRHSKAELQIMPSENLNLLSPAEKWDLLKGDYSYSATLHEMQYRGRNKRTDKEWDSKKFGWEGFCNGVRGAGINSPEPVRPITKINPDGIKITLQPADLKGLAGASYFHVHPDRYAGIGSPTREKEKNDPDRPSPGAFDIALRAFIGIGKKGFVIDTDPKEELWNETVAGYQRDVRDGGRVSGKDRQFAPTMVRKVRVSTTLSMLGEITIPDSNRATKAEVAQGRYTEPKRYDYELFLDADDKIVGGKWNSEAPDMAWFTSGEGGDDHPNFVVGGPQESNGNPHISSSALYAMMSEASDGNFRNIVPGTVAPSRTRETPYVPVASRPSRYNDPAPVSAPRADLPKRKFTVTVNRSGNWPRELKCKYDETKGESVISRGQESFFTNKVLANLWERRISAQVLPRTLKCYSKDANEFQIESTDANLTVIALQGAIENTKPRGQKQWKDVSVVEVAAATDDSGETEE